MERPITPHRSFGKQQSRKPDAKVAKAFLKHFPSCSPQTFDDVEEAGSKRGEKKLANVLATWDDKKMSNLQSQGAGIYVAVNPTTQGKRKIEALQCISALALDLDVAKEKEKKSTADIQSEKQELQKVLEGLPHPPQLIIETKNGLQPVWLFEQYREYTTHQEANNLYRNVVTGLCAVIGKPSEGDNVIRVIRVPGTWHLKTFDKPCKIKLLADKTKEIPSYKFNDFMKLYPAPAKKKNDSQKLDVIQQGDLALVKAFPIHEVLQKIGVDVRGDVIYEDGQPTSARIHSTENYINRFSGKAGSGSTIDVMLTWGGAETVREAIRKLKEIYGLSSSTFLKNAESPVLSISQWIRINPAQDYQAGTAYVTVAIEELHGNKFEQVPYLVTSAKEKLPLDQDALAHKGIAIDRQVIPELRWSAGGIQKYLEKKEPPYQLKAAYLAIKEHLVEYMDLGDAHWIDVISLWILGTYFYRLAPSFPYISLNGNMESGKSRLLEIISLLAFNGHLSAASTPAAITRLVHGNCCTLCMDEVEQLESIKDESQIALRSILNSGYRVGATVDKLEPATPKGGGFKLLKLDAFSPKALAGIKGLEASLASRCLLITMVTSGNAALKNKILLLKDPKWQQTRDMLYPTFLENAAQVCEETKMIEVDGIAGREWEIWRPILVLAKLIDAELFSALTVFARKTQKQKKEMMLEEIYAPAILQALEQHLMSVGKNKLLMTCSEIADCLTEYDPEKFSRLKDFDFPSRWISKELAKTGVVKDGTIQKKIDGKNAKRFEISLTAIQARLNIYGIEPTSVGRLPELPSYHAVEDEIVDGCDEGNPVTEVTDVEKYTDNRQIFDSQQVTNEAAHDLTTITHASE